MNDLCVLDVGAGNGFVGQELRDAGVEKIYGVDIEINAKNAVDRDRPRVYKKYYVENFMCLPIPLKKEMEEKSFNCMTTVAALGFDDIPPNVFAEKFQYSLNSGLGSI